MKIYIWVAEGDLEDLKGLLSNEVPVKNRIKIHNNIPDDLERYFQVEIEYNIYTNLKDRNLIYD